MNKYQWVAYGLDMFGYVIIETEGYDVNEAHKKALGLIVEQGLDFDTVELFDKSFIKRVNWLKD